MLELFKALADPTRLRLLAILFRGEFTVQELTSILRQGQSRVSWHLKILLEVGVVSVKRQGTWGYYRLSSDNPLFVALRPVLESRFETLPQHQSDLAGTARVLGERRRKSFDFFDRHARQWDQLVQDVLPVADYQELLLHRIPGDAGVLEVGVGTGRLLASLGAKCERVIGVDHSPAMLEEARQKVRDEALAQVDLRLGEMTHLPLGDGEVGCVVANMVFHHAADPLAVLREFLRVLDDSGVLVVADLRRHEQEWVREQLADQWLGFDPDELRDWLRQSGFCDIAIDEVPGRVGQFDVLVACCRKGNGRES